MKWLLMAFGSGALMPAQAAINTRLGKDMGVPLLAALVSFTVGTLALVAYLIATRSSLPTSEALRSAPWWAWTGGLFGAVFVAIAILVTPRVGVAAMSGYTVAGQMAASLVLDQFGLLGLDKHPADAKRIGGLVLIVLGALLLRKS